MNAIIFYYSSGGSTARVAEGLGQAMGCEVRRLGVSGKPGPGAILAAMTGMGARLTADTDLRLDGCDAVVLMTPVWAGAPAPASTTFINKAVLTGKPVYFVTVGGLPSNPKAVAALEKRLSARGAVVAGHTEVQGKAGTAPQPDGKSCEQNPPDPTDDELTACGTGLAATVMAALATARGAR